MTLLPLFYIYAAPCSLKFIKSEKDIQKGYEIIQKKSAKCAILPESYLGFSKRAYMAEHYAIAIWSSQKGLNQPQKNRNTYLELNYVMAISYLGNERHEEAIKILRGIVFDPDWQKEEANLIQKAHLALVKAYFKRNNKADDNVKYLVRLFKNRYTTSSYLYPLRSWNDNK